MMIIIHKKNKLIYRSRVCHLGIVKCIDTAVFAYCIPFWSIWGRLKEKKRTNETHHIRSSNDIRLHVETETRTQSKDEDQAPFFHYPKVVRLAVF
jgi:hypothetical protein